MFYYVQCKFFKFCLNMPSIKSFFSTSHLPLQELSGRLGELSGPLADHLRRIGEQAGDINIDVHLMKDLKVRPGVKPY